MLPGIDIGTSAVKVVLLDGLTLAVSESAYLSVESPRSGWSEQHLEHWWRASCRAMDRAAKRAGIDLSDVFAVGLSGQMRGAVLFGKDGNPHQRRALSLRTRRVLPQIPLKLRMPRTDLRTRRRPTLIKEFRRIRSRNLPHRRARYREIPA